MKILVIIPAYNEEKNIENVIKNLNKNYPQYDYVIINDCSKDNTKKILEKNNYNYIDLPVNLGIGGGVQTGYMYALDNNYDIAIQMDGDGQHDPKFISEVIKPIENGQADIVIGSRFIDKKGFQSTFMRRIGIHILSRIIKLVTGITVKDVTSGYRAVNKKFISVYAKQYAQDYPEPEAIVNAAMHNAVIKECPVIMYERLNGNSSISFFKSIYYMIKVTLSILLYRITINKRRI